MSDPGEIIAGLFSVIVTAIVVVLFVLAIQGNDITGLTSTITSLAVPFVVLLVILFFLLTVVTEL